jgi:hypothetical protein
MTDYGEIRLKLRQYKRPFYRGFRSFKLPFPQGIIAGILCLFIMFINWHKVWQFITHIKCQHRQQTTAGNNVRLNEHFQFHFFMFHGLSRCS